MRGAIPAQQPRHDGDVLADGQMGQQADLLDDVADAAAQLDRVLRHDVAAADQDLAGRRLDQPVDHLERRRLAAARRADEDADRACRHREARSLHRQQVAVASRDVAELELDGVHEGTVYACRVTANTASLAAGESAIIVPVERAHRPRPAARPHGSVGGRRRARSRDSALPLHPPDRTEGGGAPDHRAHRRARAVVQRQFPRPGALVQRRLPAARAGRSIQAA